MISIFEKVLIKLHDLPLKILEKIVMSLPAFKFIKETKNTQTPITFKMWYNQRIRGNNRYCYWPTHASSLIVNPKNIYAGVETCPGYMPGCYIQGIGKIYIGDYTQIASNVGIISANHELYDNRHHIPGNVTIGKYCWLGMGVLIMPGVVLGNNTVVGAGSVVTKSFPDGYCIIAGNPARLVRELDRDKCVEHKSDHEYNGYIPSQKFEEFRKRHLNI
jgi:acetyltransferase-like isoleucine patch superfamily enzyme